MEKRESLATTQPVSKTEKISETEEKVFKLLIPKHKESAINMADARFKKLYGEEAVRRDKLNVESKKARIKEEGSEPSKRAQILEAVLSEQIELSNWFGQEAMTIVPSEYDDIYHGIDSAIEFGNPNQEFQYLTMGLDVTSSSNFIEKKLRKIKSHIIDGSLTKMKYFISERNDSRPPGLNEKIPNTVIGVDKKAIQELSELWLTINQGRQTNKQGLSPESIQSQKERVKEAQKKLAEHRVQVMLLEQIEKQLVVFSEFAKKCGKDEIVKKYESLLELVREVLKDKEISDEDEEKNQEDKVFKALDYALQKFDDIPLE